MANNLARVQVRFVNDINSPGTRLNRYEILSKLGEGGMGEVFLAEDTSLRRKIAIKILQSPFTTDDKARMRLVREAQAAAALDHHG